MLIDDALKDLEERKERISSWREAECVALKVKEKFSRNGIEIEVGVDWILARDGIELRIYKIRNMKDLNPIFRFLAQSGFTHSGPIIYERLKMVQWRCDKIELDAYFNSHEPDACKFKQVGTEETPIYEIDCPGLK